MGSDRSEKEIVGYCARDIGCFALGACGNKERVSLRNSLQAQTAQNKFSKEVVRDVTQQIYQGQLDMI